MSTSAFLFLFHVLLALTLKRPFQYLKYVRDARVSFPFLGLFLGVCALAHARVNAPVYRHMYIQDVGWIWVLFWRYCLAWVFFFSRLIYFIFVYTLCKCTTCMSGVYKGQKSLDPLEVMNICEPTCCCWAPNTVPL